MDFIQLLKSFGLDMSSVANALGIDMHTLNNMDHDVLLHLLTQQTNWKPNKPFLPPPLPINQIPSIHFTIAPAPLSLSPFLISRFKPKSSRNSGKRKRKKKPHTICIAFIWKWVKFISCWLKSALEIQPTWESMETSCQSPINHLLVVVGWVMLLLFLFKNRFLYYPFIGF